MLNVSHSALFHLKTGVSLKYFVNDCLWKPFFYSNSPQTPSNFENFCNSEVFHTVLT